MKHEFKSPRVIYGWGALSHLAELPAQRTAVITDAVVEQLGLVAQAGHWLDQSGSSWAVTGRVGHEPCVPDVPPLAASLQDYAPARVIALGGGSVLDAAKAAWAFYEHPDLTWEQALRPGAWPLPARRADFVAIPTTSGTGSEVSSVAVLIDADTRLKRLILSPGIVPTEALVDPALAASMPPGLTAQSALDALTHAVEALVTALANDFSSALALRAIRLIFEHLPNAFHTGDRTAREGLHRAATLAGLAATNAFAGLAHGMDQVGPLFNLPHGQVCAVLLPYTMVFNLEAAQSAYAEMGAAVGAAAEDALAQARGFVRAVMALERAVGLPLSFAAAGVNHGEYERQLPTLVAAALASRSTALSPRLPSAAEASQLFIDAYEGNLPEWVKP